MSVIELPNAVPTDPVEEIMRRTGGAWSSRSSAGVSAVLRQAVEALGPMATCVSGRRSGMARRSSST